MVLFFVLLNFFSYRRRNFCLRQIKILLIVLFLTKTSSTFKDNWIENIRELNRICQKLKTPAPETNIHPSDEEFDPSHEEFDPSHEEFDTFDEEFNPSDNGSNDEESNPFDKDYNHYDKELNPNQESNSSYDASCRNCGLSNGEDIQQYVINGSPVNLTYRYPWMVALSKGGKTQCGGAIISEYFILTAAHCISDTVNKTDSMQISFLTGTREVTPGYAVESIHPHPQYDDAAFAVNDIALIKLKDKITCDMYKSPICLPKENVILPPSTELTLAGWGAVQGGENPQYPDQLLEGKILTSNCSICESKLGVDRCESGSVYCMVAAENQAACFGDSGGPMFMKIEEKYYIQGVTSGGDSECRPGYPFLFTSVSYMRSWISQVSGV